jgi:hypothetical protein
MDTSELSARDAELALIDAKRSVVRYVEQIGGVPADKFTEFNAALDRGDWDYVNRMLAELERERNTRINITTYYRQVGSASAPVQPGGGRSHTGRRVTPGQSIQPLSGEGFVADTGGRVISREDMADHNTGGGSTTNHYTIKLETLGGISPAQIQQLKSALVEVERERKGAM